MLFRSQRLVQEGQDLRHVTGQILSHMRDLMVVHSAPEERAVLDVAPERHQRLAAQAAKFTTPELARVVSLLLAAQTDMRWTTSPRLTLELALLRCTVPGSDPNAAGLGARIERLERLAGLDPSARVPEAVPPIDAGQVATPLEQPAESAPHEEPVLPTAPDQPHAPSAGSLDLHTIRRSWPQLLDRLQERRQMILRANLESVTAAAYDGSTLELAFPPGRKFAVQKVQSKEDELREVFAEVFGVHPRILCAAREAVPGVLLLEEDGPAPSHEDAIERLKAELGAEVEEIAEAP